MDPFVCVCVCAQFKAWAEVGLEQSRYLEKYFLNISKIIVIHMLRSLSVTHVIERETFNFIWTSKKDWNPDICARSPFVSS